VYTLHLNSDAGYAVVLPLTVCVTELEKKNYDKQNCEFVQPVTSQFVQPRPVTANLNHGPTPLPLKALSPKLG